MDFSRSLDAGGAICRMRWTLHGSPLKGLLPCVTSICSKRLRHSNLSYSICFRRFGNGRDRLGLCFGACCSRSCCFGLRTSFYVQSCIGNASTDISRHVRRRYDLRLRCKDGPTMPPALPRVRASIYAICSHLRRKSIIRVFLDYKQLCTSKVEMSMRFNSKGLKNANGVPSLPWQKHPRGSHTHCATLASKMRSNVLPSCPVSVHT